MRRIIRPFSVLGRSIRKLVDKNYIKNKLKKRKGRCRKCGQCCKGCIYLDKKTNLCRTYKSRPWFCYKDFPLDKFDQKLWNVKNCGYKFKD